MPVPQSFIKNIALQLRSNYQFDNSPYNENNIDSLFIGRKDLLQKFLKFLKTNSSEKRGVFLVTGYRGMGKTSFVNNVIANYENPNKIPVRLTIAQNNPNELDVLKQIVSSIYDKYRENSTDYKRSEKEIHLIKGQIRKIKLCLALGIVFTLLTIPVAIETDFAVKFLENDIYTFPIGLGPIKLLSYFFLLFTTTVIIILYCKHYQLEKIKDKSENEPLLKQIRDLAERTFSNVSEEHQNSKFLNIDFKGFKAVTEDSLPKKAKNYPIANAKEIEYELISFLDKTKNSTLDFIFIFDELDKVDLVNNQGNLYQDLDSFEMAKKDSNLQNLVRNRKQAVMNVISSLKNFFTTANARFIFIAGREMFDASLADVADKQSPLSSIFTYIFNIESLLKEEAAYSKEKNTSSLTNAIEEFLKYQLASKWEIENDRAKTIPALFNGPKGAPNSKWLSEISFFDYLRHTYEPVKNINSPDEETYKKQIQEYGKIYYMFQGFITYLAYRSNGSPKKLIKAFHEFVSIKNEPYDHDKVVERKQVKDNESKFYLYFNYYNQYRIGFINYMYRPFLIQQGRSFKLFSDNAIISIPYLFDHLIKFHPFAFSRSNLELVPELLSSTKTPGIKHDLDSIITHLGSTHVRDTDIELFDYKFYSKSYNEIAFLSRIFEEEAAAFNFTLDENYPVKLLLNDKIKELRTIFSKFYKDFGALPQQIFSIAFHNGNLGDLHFFDQEFDDAIGNYSDAIRPINNIRIHEMNIRDFVTLIRNKLKVGLCFEKISSYEEAITFYSDSTQDVKRYMAYHLTNSTGLKNSFFPPESKLLAKTKHDDFFHSSSFNDLLQIVVQCFLSKLYIQEKMGLEGITTNKVRATLGEFLKLADAVSNICGRNHLIIANSFMHLGKLLYFKNSPLATKDDTGTTGNYPKWMSNRLESINNVKSIYSSKIDLTARRQPFLACRMYLLALDEVMRSRKKMCFSNKRSNVDDNELLHCNGRLNLIEPYYAVLENYLKSGDESYTANHYKYIANLISSIGDCMLGMHGLKTNDISNKRFKIIKSSDYNNLCIESIFISSKFDSSNFNDALHKSVPDHFTIADVLRCYYIAGQYYEKYGRTASASFQYRKILYVLRLVIYENQTSASLVNRFIDFIGKTLVKKAKDIAGQNIERTDRHMAIKAKAMRVPDNSIWNNISNHPDLKEIVLLFEYIKLKLGIGNDSISDLINPNNSIATQYSRLMELDYYAKYILLMLRPTTDIQDLQERKLKLGLQPNIQLVIDFFYTMNTILRLLKIYGSDYTLGYSYIAYIHFRVALFIEKTQVLGKEEISDVMEKLEKLLGSGSFVLIDKRYHYSMAKDHYQKAIQLHTAGNSYKKTVKDMIYLEDDFNDNAYHFGAALDRYILTKKVFMGNIDACDEALSRI